MTEAGALLCSPGAMNRTKRLTGVCSECGGSIQFQAELIGTVATCPRCRKQTELMLESPPERTVRAAEGDHLDDHHGGDFGRGADRDGGGAEAFREAGGTPEETATAAAAETNGAAVPAGFEVSAITLEKGDGGNGLFAVGTVVNNSNRRRSQVTVELDLLDAGGQTLQVVRAYRPLLEPGAKWEIKLPVGGDSKPVSAKLASIREGQ